jgi:hypothetical protein
MRCLVMRLTETVEARFCRPKTSFMGAISDPAEIQSLSADLLPALRVHLLPHHTVWQCLAIKVTTRTCDRQIIYGADALAFTVEFDVCQPSKLKSRFARITSSKSCVRTYSKLQVAVADDFSRLG